MSSISTIYSWDSSGSRRNCSTAPAASAARRVPGQVTCETTFRRLLLVLARCSRSRSCLPGCEGIAGAACSGLYLILWHCDVLVHGSGMTLVQAPTASRASALGLFWPPHRHRAMPPVKRQFPRLKQGIPSPFARYSVADISAKMTLSAAERRSLSPYQSPIRASTRAVSSRHRQFQEAPSGRRR